VYEILHVFLLMVYISLSFVLCEFSEQNRQLFKSSNNKWLHFLIMSANGVFNWQKMIRLVKVENLTLLAFDNY